jgi:Asp-tRNA(Asn)/Glu-tRNA(Gln) amidotransferase A subunit family amidase
MSASIAAQMLSSARQILGDEPDERVRAQVERLAGHVEALNAFPLPDEAPPYFPARDPLPEQPSHAAVHAATEAQAPSGELHTLGAVEIAALIAARKVSVEEVARATLDRIAATEKSLQAWVWVDHEQVIADAKKLDAMQGAAWPRGPLHGVPVGVKDIYDVAGMPTRAGSRVLAGAPPAKQDSWLVARLRAAGALIIGKTATTEFAYADPAGTRNPWNLAHTPGGSSSGSAAAVAARVVPIALGSQTAGSVIRPASFCGVVGFKPTWGRVPLEGVIPFAWSLDTAGWLTRTVADAALVWRAIGGEGRPRGAQERGFTVMPDPLAELDARGWATLERYDEIYGWHEQREVLSPAAGMIEAVESAAREMRREGGESDSASRANQLFLSAVLDSQQVIMAVEAAAQHRARFAQQASEYGARITALVAAGLTVSAADYLRAQRVRAWLRSNTLRRAGQDESDFWLVPSAPGAAPEGLDFTGDPAFNAPWTQFGFPAITLFGGTNDAGLPLGVQLVGRPGADADLLNVAGWAESVLGQAPSPPEFD